MTNEQHPLDKAIKSLIDEYEHTPPHYVWSDIQASLRETKRKRRRTALWYAAASWLIVLSFGTGYYFHQSNEPTNQFTAQNTQNSTDVIALPQSNNIVPAKTSRTLQHQRVSIAQNSILDIVPLQSGSMNDIVANSHNQETAIVAPQPEVTPNNDIANNVDTASKLDTTALILSYLSGGMNQTIDDSSQSLLLENNLPLYADASNEINNWQFGGGATPLYSFSMGSSDQEMNGGTTQLKDGINTAVANDAKTKPSIYTSGMYVKRNISKNVKLRSGFYYNRIINGTTTTNGIEVPMLGELNVIDAKHLQVSVNSGLGAGMESQAWYPYGMGGVTVAVPLSPRLHMNVEPMFKHTFSESTVHNNNFFGVFTGVSYSF